MSLDRIAIKGYKSLADVDIELRPLNVLIGANGAGKSNVISLLSLLRLCVEGRFQYEVLRRGGGNALLHFGQETTEFIEVHLY
ncbi:MAG: AAA family ATPase, partial [Myxococcota bacterium]